MAALPTSSKHAARAAAAAVAGAEEDDLLEGLPELVDDTAEEDWEVNEEEEGESDYSEEEGEDGTYIEEGPGGGISVVVDTDGLRDELVAGFELLAEMSARQTEVMEAGYAQIARALTRLAKSKE